MQVNPLEIYYKAFFPSDELMRYLSVGCYDGTQGLERREFAFFWNDKKGGMIPQRFKSYQTSDELLIDMVSNLPNRVDIGPVYNVPPKFRKFGIDVKPTYKEIVFDIDMDDYDHIRDCSCVNNIDSDGSTKRVCNDCWKILACSSRILEYILRKKFGLVRLLWIFSGKKGVHCWAKPRDGESYSDKFRTQMVEYLDPFTKKDRYRVKDNYINCPILMDYTFNDIALPFFNELMESKKSAMTFKSEKTQNIINQCIASNAEFTSAGKPNWGKTVGRTWKECVNIISEICSNVRRVVFAIVMKCLFPIIDQNVTKKTFHLLKSPFSVHNITGNICVPLDLNTMHHFDVGRTLHVNDAVSDPNRFFAEFKNTYIPRMVNSIGCMYQDIQLPRSLFLCYYCVIRRHANSGIDLEELLEQCIIYTDLRDWITHTMTHQAHMSDRDLYTTARRCLAQNFAIEACTDPKTLRSDFNLARKVLEVVNRQ